MSFLLPHREPPILTLTMTDNDPRSKPLDLSRLYREPPGDIDPVAWWKAILEYEGDLSDDALDDELATLLEAIQFQR